MAEDTYRQNGLYHTPYTIDMYKALNAGIFELYNQKIKSSPESIYLILTEFSTAEFIEEKLGLVFNLTNQQIAELTRIIRDVLLGDRYIGDLISNVSSGLALDREKSKQIVDKILFELFAPALDDIKKIQREKFADRIKNPASSPQQSRPAIDPIIASQRMRGSDQNQRPPAGPQTVSRPPSPPASIRDFPSMNQSRPPAPQTQQPQRPQQNQPTYRPVTPPQPRPATPSAPPKEFKMPAWTPPSQSKEPVRQAQGEPVRPIQPVQGRPAQGEPRQNENAGRTLDLRELENK